MFSHFRVRLVAGTLLFGVFVHATAMSEDVLSSITDSQKSIIIPKCRVSVFQKRTVSAERLGILQSVAIAEGELIKQEEIIAQLKDDSAKRVLATLAKEAENDVDLRYAQKLSELSTMLYSRAVQLNRDIPGAKSDSDVARLKLSAENAMLQVEQAAHQLEVAQLRKVEAEAALETYKVRAPISGIVLQTYKHSGEAVHAGEAIADIANFDQMRVEGFLPAALAWSIKKGDSIQVVIEGYENTPAVNRQRFEGKVTFVDPVINEVSQKVRIWAEVQNLDHLLKDGLICTMEILRDRPVQRRAQAFPIRDINRN